MQLESGLSNIKKIKNKYFKNATVFQLTENFNLESNS